MRTSDKHRMKFRDIIAAWLLLPLPIGFACAQDSISEQPIEQTSYDAISIQEDPLTSDQSHQFLLDEFVAETGDDPSAMQGSGFRWFARFSAAGAYATEETSGWGESDFTAFGSDYRFGSKPSIDVGNLRFDPIHVSDGHEFKSAELMAQHLWDGHWGIKDWRPALRGSLHAYGLGVDLGRLPLAEVGGFDFSLGPNPKGWMGFHSARYFGYGVRATHGLDGFYWSGNIDGINGWGNTFSNSTIDHYLIGPQLSLGQVAALGRWRFDFSGHLLLGYGRNKTKVVGGFGENIITGGRNNSAVAQPTYSTSTAEEEQFA